MKLVLCGDLHLGRRSSLVAEFDGREHRAAAAWLRVVELAVAEQAAAVLVAGDLIDQDNRFYEARGPIRSGLDRLQQAGITTFAVAGNHDAEALPYVARHLAHPALRLVGEGGAWESLRIEVGDEAVQLVGWSFPQAWHESSPLATPPPIPEPNVPTIGLLHADLDTAGSRYAPCSSSALAACGYDLWVCGHQHAPRRFESGGRLAALYVGSPQALDAGEPGAHGAWVLETDSGGEPELRPLSSVRYDAPEIDLDGVTDKASWDQAVQTALDAWTAKAVAESGPAIEVLSLRPRWVGACDLGRQIDEWYAELAKAEAEAAGVPVRLLDRPTDATRAAVDLAALATGQDPPGRLARILLDLDADPPGPQASGLVQQAMARLDGLDRYNPYVPLVTHRRQAAETDHGGQPAESRDGRGEAIDRVRRQTHRLLALLLAQEAAR